MDLNSSVLRPGQLKAIDVIITRIADGQTRTAIVKPTRYGKSDIIRLSALLSQAKEYACQSMVLSPSADLRNQIVNKKQLLRMAKRYGLPIDRATRVHRIDKPEIAPGSNSEYLLSSTIHLVHTNIHDFCDLIDSRIHTSGKPFVIYIDETHLLSEDNKWGRSVVRMTEVGALFVLLTATPVRSDRTIIPGFDVRQIDERTAFKREIAQHPTDDTKIIVDVYEGVESLVELVAHDTTTFQEAWDERPSPLCALTRDAIDIDLTEYQFLEVKSNTHLSDLSASQARKILGQVCRDPRVIRLGAEKLVRNLLPLKEMLPDAGAIIFTGADKDPERRVNEHAEEVRRAIEQVSDDAGVALECVIATASGGEKPSRLLQRFAEGNGDVLIVKNAGGAGFDCERLKVLLDLSPTRTVASTYQRLMRVATPWNQIRVGVIISLADCLMSALWQSLVVEPGGEWVRGNFELIDSYERPKGQDKQEQSVWVVDAAAVGSFDDSHMNVGDIDIYPEIERLITAFPELVASYTKPQIAQRWVATCGASENIVVLDDEICALQNEIIDCCTFVAKRQMQDRPYSHEAFRESLKSVYSELLSGISLPGSTRRKELIRSIVDLEQLKILRARARTLCQPWEPSDDTAGDAGHAV